MIEKTSQADDRVIKQHATLDQTGEGDAGSTIFSDRVARSKVVGISATSGAGSPFSISSVCPELGTQHHKLFTTSNPSSSRLSCENGIFITGRKLFALPNKEDSSSVAVDLGPLRNTSWRFSRTRRLRHHNAGKLTSPTFDANGISFGQQK